MPLTFPTQAEQALEKFNTSTKTISLATIAKKMGAEVEKKGARTVYLFEDDTTLEVTGRGRAHRAETFLP